MKRGEKFECFGRTTGNTSNGWSIISGVKVRDSSSNGEITPLVDCGIGAEYCVWNR
jgi:hypothetical protein